MGFESKKSDSGPGLHPRARVEEWEKSEMISQDPA